MASTTPTSPSLDQAWAKLESAQSKSLLKKFLTPEVYAQLKDVKTSSGASLLDAIQSGVANLDSGVGVYAPDVDSYRAFAPLFNPIIADYHKVDLHAGPAQPRLNFGDLSYFRDIDSAGKYILSTRIRCARSLKAFPLNPRMTKDDYLNLERTVRDVLLSEAMQKELGLDYYALGEMTESKKTALIDGGYLYKEGDRFLEAAHAVDHWPTGRGIFYNEAKTALVWLGEEDHLRIMCMQKGADLGQVYKRFVALLQAFDEDKTAAAAAAAAAKSTASSSSSSSALGFARDENLGFLTLCPTNIGTGIRASVHIKLPNLGEDKMKAIADENHLQIRGTRGEHSDNVGGVFDVSNKRRLGLTEFEAVKDLQDGVLKLIAAEEAS